ncbi:LytR family transcriptional regulator, partial [Streptomyces sp. SID8385]|nr:LytR family transcriptional regulator [Streptomyces sp. SID8385]
MRLSPSDGRPPGNGRRGAVPRSRRAPDREHPQPGQERPRRPAPEHDDPEPGSRPSRETVPGQRR